ncbi:MAG: FHA domain-containing protein, partial [Planctomycetes bacterium]|nr:FHA domain-containing protein [Planctomycetota bacterium]
MGTTTPSGPGRGAGKSFAKLIVQENGAERVIELRGRTTTIGRAHENDVAIDDINSSRRHCQIERGANGYEIVDLKSRNGTLVNGILVLRKELRPGDLIEIGKTRMFFEHISSEYSEETIDLSTDFFLEPLSGLEEEDQLSVLKKEREIFLKLLEINRNLNSRIVLSDLLDMIIDTVVDVTGAERGFLVLAEASGASLQRTTIFTATAASVADGAYGAGAGGHEPEGGQGDTVYSAVSSPPGPPEGAVGAGVGRAGNPPEGAVGASPVRGAGPPEGTVSSPLGPPEGTVGASPERGAG